MRVAGGPSSGAVLLLDAGPWRERIEAIAAQRCWPLVRKLWDPRDADELVAGHRLILVATERPAFAIVTMSSVRAVRVVLARDPSIGELELCLGYGASDYIAPDLPDRAVEAKLAVAQRWAATVGWPEIPPIVKLGPLRIDVRRHEVLIHERPVPALTPIEWDLLCVLAAARGQVCSRQELLRQIWNDEGEMELHSVDSHIYRLRAKLGMQAIASVPGVGYRLDHIENHEVM